MDPSEYLDLVAERLASGGATVTTEQIGPIIALVGYRARFRMRWMASTLHLFTVVVPAPWTVTAAALERFGNDAIDFADSRKGALRGFQSGVAAIPVLVGPDIQPDAKEYAQTQILRRYAAFAWPAVVDLTERRVYRHEGRVAIGAVFSGYLRAQTALALPEPPG